jgi:[acyl-carrier-protein] S-malonyltransferase
VGPGKVVRNLARNNNPAIQALSLDVWEDRLMVNSYMKTEYRLPFVSRCMGLAVSARNTCWDNELYRQGVIQPYNTLRSMQERVEAEERAATEAEMLQGAQLLKTILDTKGCPQAEQAERFADLLADTGMEQKLVLPF